MEEKEQIVKHKSGVLKWLILALVLVLVITLVIGYILIARSYQTRFLPNTTLNGVDCSGMTAAETAAVLTPSLEAYVLVVEGRDIVSDESGAVLGQITSVDINMRFDGVQTAVEQELQKQNEYGWIVAWLRGEPEEKSVDVRMVYDEDKLRDYVLSWDAFQEKKMRAPKDAYISGYMKASNAYQVIPETVGTKMDIEQAYSCIKEALGSNTVSLDLEEMGCYESPHVRQDDKKLNETVETVNQWLSANITYDWNGAEVILDKELLQGWISVVDDEPVLDVEQVKDFVKKQAAKYDTYGKARRFVTTHGIELTLPSGYYGWKTDIETETDELIQLIDEGSTTEREPVYSSEARAKGVSDIGNSYVEADMIHQHLYLYFNGAVVLETDFVSGNMSNGCNTPAGVFGVAYKTTNAVLRGADYETPVSYWMPYYNNYGMHDASWRSEFGGDIYLTDGSHGCINLPIDIAEQIYQYVSKGFPVICYYYEEDPLAVPEESTNDDYDDDDEEDW